ncbi:hypothetical protein B0H16DRAFT_1898232 [Mycena metata]|uniref:Uncharacterized protein n=1 Tax=Mycena metata TaxID=1033252 RepID=A0AAD7MHS6_9AGAR|nr:hypothetical protein B0H16DRAFT_1898232 [Mycena metata]
MALLPSCSGTPVTFALWSRPRTFGHVSGVLARPYQQLRYNSGLSPASWICLWSAPARHRSSYLCSVTVFELVLLEPRYRTHSHLTARGQSIGHPC